MMRMALTNENGANENLNLMMVRKIEHQLFKQWNATSVTFPLNNNHEYENK